MDMNGTKRAGMMRGEANPSQSVLYQVCVDHPGQEPFDGTGVQFDNHAKALAHLKDTQRTKPQAYLAAVTYQRCNAAGQPLQRHESDDRNKPTGTARPRTYAERAERIADFARFGMRTTEMLQAVAGLLGRLKPTEEDDPGQVAEDLVLAVDGMVRQLETIHELFDDIEIQAGHVEESAALTNQDRSAHTEPALV